MKHLLLGGKSKIENRDRGETDRLDKGLVIRSNLKKKEKEKKKKKKGEKL